MLASEPKEEIKPEENIAGNGGSAADSQHFAAELIGRYKKNRRPYKAISLTTDTSVITCIANDFGYEKIFERQLQGLGQKGDSIIAFSTSGNSKNILEALKFCKRKKSSTFKRKLLTKLYSWINFFYCSCCYQFVSSR